MTKAHTPPSRTSAFTGLFILSMLVSPAHGHERSEQMKDPCMDTSRVTTHSSAAASSSSGAHARAETAGGKNSQAAASSCVGPHCTSSSAASTRHNGLSGSSTLPDGSSVTVHAGNGVVSSSTVHPDSSGASNANAASSDPLRDCTTRNDPQTYVPESDRDYTTKEKQQ